MKKSWMCILAVLLFAPAAFADNWGLGLKLGAGQNDPKTMKEDFDELTGFDRELTRSGGVFGLEAMYEWDVAGESNKIGVKLGVDIYGDNELKFTAPIYEKITESTVGYPITVYYKKDQGVKKLSYFAGAGITHIHSKIEWEGLVNGTDRKNKVFPHVVAGAEYRFTRVFALGLEARYNIAAKVKKDGDVMSDRSGFGGALTGRFYF